MDEQDINLDEALAQEEGQIAAPTSPIRQRAAKLFPNLVDAAPAPTTMTEADSMALDAAIQGGFVTPENYTNELARFSQDPAVQAQLAQQAEQRFGVNRGISAQDTADMQAQVTPFERGTPTEQVGEQTVLAPAAQRAALAAEQAAAQAAEAELAAQKNEQDAALAAQAEELARKKQAQAVQKEAAAQQKAQQRVEQQDAQAQQQVQEVDEDGLTMRQALAIMLGGIGQGLTGAQKNPAVEMLEALSQRRMKRIEQEAERKKLDFDQKLALQKAEMDRQMNLAKMVQMQSENELTRAKIGELGSKMAEARNLVEQQQQLLGLEKQRGLTIDEVRTLPPEEREFYAQLPNGNYTRVFNKVRAKELSAEIADRSQALQGIDRLLEINKEVGNNPLRKFTDRDIVAESNTIQQKIKGKLRLDLFGPGVMTDFENRLADQIIRNPTDMFTIASANEAALKVLKKKVKYGNLKAVEAAGGVLPDYMKQNELLLQAAKRKYPNAKTERLITELIKQGKWLDE